MNPYPKSCNPRHHPVPYRGTAAAQAAGSVHRTRATGRESRVPNHRSPIANLHFLFSLFPFPAAPRENYAHFNRHKLQLETSATSRKQTTAADSNRHNFAAPRRLSHHGRAASTHATNPWHEIRSSFAAQNQPRKKSVRNECPNRAQQTQKKVPSGRGHAAGRNQVKLLCPLLTAARLLPRLYQVLRRPGVQRRDQPVGRWRHRCIVSQYDVLRRNLLTVNSHVGVVVGPDRRTLQRYAGEYSASAGIAQDFSTQRNIRFRRRVPAHWASRHRSISTKLYFAAQDAVGAAVIHHQQDEVRCLSADLKAHAATLEGHHRRRAPRTVEVLAPATGHRAAAITGADHERSLQHRRKHHDAVSFIQQVLRYVVWNIQNLVQHGAGSLQTILIFLGVVCPTANREQQQRAHCECEHHLLHFYLLGRMNLCGNTGRTLRTTIAGLISGSVAAQKMHQQRDEEHSQKNKKENLGNARRGESDASKSQKSRDQCDHQENQCVIQHVSLLALCHHRTCACPFSACPDAKMNAHVETRLGPLTGPYVESCNQSGILPVHPIRGQFGNKGREPIARYSVLRERLGRQQKLHAEIPHEARLDVARRLDAAPGLQQQNERRVNFVARANVDGLLSAVWVEGSQGVELGINFEILGQVMPHDDAGEPSINTFMHGVVAHFPVQIYHSELFRKLHRKNQTCVARSDSAVSGMVRIVEGNLRKNRDCESRLFIFIKSPLQTQLILAEPIFRSARRSVHAQPGVFKSKLNPSAQAVIDIHVGRVRDGLVVIQERHVAQIDFPIVIAGSAWIVGVIGRPALRKRRRANERTHQKKKDYPWPKSGERNRFSHSAPFKLQLWLPGRQHSD